MKERSGDTEVPEKVSREVSRLIERAMEISRLKGKRKIVMLTAYDSQLARILDEVGVDIILVGDSVGTTVLGYGSTKLVTMEDMLHHTGAVARGVKDALIVSDMPKGTYSTPTEAVKNAKALLKAGAQAVKIEGNKPAVVSSLIDEGIPVMGHVGLLPQTAERYRVMGKEEAEAERIYKDALELARSGVFSIVLECIPKKLARKITEEVKVPTIGIGAGRFCDGQVLVVTDMLGLDERFKPKFVKRYANLSKIIREAVMKFKEEVLSGLFPDEEHTYH